MKLPIKIAVVDDHDLFRKGFISLLKDYKEIEVVIEAANGIELLSQLKNKKVDVILMDIQMPKMDGIETTEKIRKKNIESKIIVITSHNEDEFIQHLISKGANGFLLKNEDIEIVLDAIFAVIDNDYFFNDKVSKAMVKALVKNGQIVPSFTAKSLSEREIQIIRLISKEFNSREIGEKLEINCRSVEGHKDRILKKIKVKNSIGIIMYAVKHNLL